MLNISLYWLFLDKYSTSIKSLPFSSAGEGSDPVKVFGGSATSPFLQGCLEAMDLLRNLPEGVTTTTTWPTKCPEHHLRRSTTCPIPLQCPGNHSHTIDDNTRSNSNSRPIDSSSLSLRKRLKGDSALNFYNQSTDSSTCNVSATTTEGSTSVNLQVHTTESNESEILCLNIHPTGGTITSVPSSVMVSSANSATSITTC